VTGLPPIDQALLPADVRKGSAGDRKTYAAALGFERALVQELAKTMAETAKPVDGGDGDDGAEPKDAASSMYMQQLPDQLADSVIQNGGLGLARNLYDSMKERGK
jgi:Rod binding domain-containing protein